jgi:predicted dehydrogenase
MTNNSQISSRRGFLQTTGALAGAAAVGSLSLDRSVHAAGSDVIKVGLIGCGGRGSGAAVNAMNAGKDVRLVAMADIFEDRLQGARQRITKIHPEQTAVADDHCFIGLDAYQKLLASGIDVVIVAGSSYFHPTHVKAAVEAGKHIFCEKPHGLDVPGVKSIQASAEEAKKKNLNFVSGLCWRYDRGMREAMARIKDGAIGDIVAIQETYITSPYVCRPRQEGWGEMYYQLQNWYHFNWLSGDQTAQQLIHSLDKGSWAMGDVPPVKAWGMGGRQVCTDPKYGDQFDHHAVVFEYANGVRMFGLTRDIPGCYNETSDVIFGTKGRAILPRKPRIEGANPWVWEGELKPTMYDCEHMALFDAIRSGKVINNAAYGTLSSMLAIMAQMVCYTGQEVTWEQAMASSLVLGPKVVSFDAEPPVKPDANGIYPTPMPGITKWS